MTANTRTIQTLKLGVRGELGRVRVFGFSNNQKIERGKKGVKFCRSTLQTVAVKETKTEIGNHQSRLGRKEKRAKKEEGKRRKKRGTARGWRVRLTESRPGPGAERIHPHPS